MKKKIIIILIILIILILLYLVNAHIQNASLFQAIEKNDYMAVQKAINRGAWINFKQYDSFSIWPRLVGIANPTPLIAACKEGNENIVALLLENGADINKADDLSNYTPLYAVLSSKNEKRFQLAQYLIEQGAMIESEQHSGPFMLQNILYIAPTDDETVIQSSLTLLKFVLENDHSKTLLKQPYYSSINPLIFAARYKNHLAVEYFIENGYFDVDCTDKNGETALIVAAKYHQYKVAEILVGLGADKEIIDTQNKTALDYAKENNDQKMVALLRQ